MRTILGIIASIFFMSSPCRGQVSCGEQPKEVPPDIQQTIQGDVEGKAQLFTKLFGDSELKGKVAASKNEVYQKYKDIDKHQIDAFMVWVSCQNIMHDKTLTPTQKNELWIKIYRELKLGRNSSIDIEALRIVRIDKTSIKYLISKLGEPTNNDGSIARFDFGGYAMFVHYAGNDATAGEVPGTILGLAFVAENSNIDSSISLTGEWNQKAYCSAKDKDIHAMCSIISDTGFGVMHFKEYLKDVDNCYVDYFSHVGDNPAFFKSSCDNRITIYIPDDSTEAENLDRAKLSELFIDFTDTIDDPNPKYKFGPPRYKSLDDMDNNKRARLKFVGNLTPARLEVGDYVASYVSIDETYESFHRAQDFPKAKLVPK